MSSMYSMPPMPSGPPGPMSSGGPPITGPFSTGPFSTGPPFSPGSGFMFGSGFGSGMPDMDGCLSSEGGPLLLRSEMSPVGYVQVRGHA
eukprot:3023528-Rhodomonas_salina.1